MDKTYNDLMDIVNRTKKFDNSSKPKMRPIPTLKSRRREEEYEPREYDLDETIDEPIVDEIEETLEEEETTQPKRKTKSSSSILSDTSKLNSLISKTKKTTTKKAKTEKEDETEEKPKTKKSTSSKSSKSTPKTTSKTKTTKVDKKDEPKKQSKEQPKKEENKKANTLKNLLANVKDIAEEIDETADKKEEQEEIKKVEETKPEIQEEKVEEKKKEEPKPTVKKVNNQSQISTITSAPNDKLYEALHNSLFSGGTDISEYMTEDEEFNSAQASLKDLKAKREAQKINEEISKEQQEYEQLFTGSLGSLYSEEEVEEEEEVAETKTETQPTIENNYELHTSNPDLDKRIAEYYKRKQEKINEYNAQAEDYSQPTANQNDSDTVDYEAIFSGNVMSRNAVLGIEEEPETIDTEIESEENVADTQITTEENKDTVTTEETTIDTTSTLEDAVSSVEDTIAETTNTVEDNDLESTVNSYDDTTAESTLDIQEENVNIENESSNTTPENVEEEIDSTYKSDEYNIQDNATNIDDIPQMDSQNINGLEESAAINLGYDKPRESNFVLVDREPEKQEIVEYEERPIVETQDTERSIVDMSEMTSVEDIIEDQQELDLENENTTAYNEDEDIHNETLDEESQEELVSYEENMDENNEESSEEVIGDNVIFTDENMSEDFTISTDENLDEDVSTYTQDEDNYYNSNENEDIHEKEDEDVFEEEDEVVDQEFLDKFNKDIEEGKIDSEFNDNIYNMMDNIESVELNNATNQESKYLNDLDDVDDDEDVDNIDDDMYIEQLGASAGDIRDMEHELDQAEDMASETSLDEDDAIVVDSENTISSYNESIEEEKEENDDIYNIDEDAELDDYIVSSNVIDNLSEDAHFESIVNNERMYEQQKDEPSHVVFDDDEEDNTYVMNTLPEQKYDVLGNSIEEEKVDYTTEKVEDSSISREEFYNEMARLQENLINELKGSKTESEGYDFFAEKQKAQEQDKAEKLVEDIITSLEEDDDDNITTDEDDSWKLPLDDDNQNDESNPDELEKVDDEDKDEVDEISDEVENTQETTETETVDDVICKAEPVDPADFDKYNLLDKEVALNEEDLKYQKKGNEERVPTTNDCFYGSKEDVEKKTAVDEYMTIYEEHTNEKSVGDINLFKDINNATPSSEIIKELEPKEKTEPSNEEIETIYTLMGIQKHTIQKEVEPIKVLYCTSECQPFIASGGLADVAGSLPKEIAKDDNMDIRVILPLYGNIKKDYRDKFEYLGNFTVHLSWRQEYCGLFRYFKDGVTYYFIDNERYFKRDSLYGYFDDGERFAYFSRAIVECLPHINFFPDIIHCNDWQTSLVSAYIKTSNWNDFRYYRIKNVYTIHNVEYQGVFGMYNLKDLFGIDSRFQNDMEYNRDINLTKAAIQFSDRFTTVSHSYCDNLKQPYCSRGLHHIIIRNEHKLSGILNGIDYDFYNPATDTQIFKNFDIGSIDDKVLNKKLWQDEIGLPVDGDTPMVAVVSRLVGHKGLDLITKIIYEVLEQDIQFVVVGTGDEKYVKFFKELESRFPTKVRVFVDKYCNETARKAYAASDIFVMPSKIEPCGLSQMISSRYGSIPIVREVGGLKDSIKDFGCAGGGNGYTFTNYNPNDLKYQLNKAISDYHNTAEWKNKIKTCMSMDFTWKKPAQEYISLYKSLKD